MKNLKYVLTLLSSVNLLAMQLMEFDVNNNNGNPGIVPQTNLVTGSGLIKTKKGPVTTYSLNYQDNQGKHILSWHNNEVSNKFWKSRKDLASGWRGTQNAVLEEDPDNVRQQFYNAQFRYNKDTGAVNPDTFKEPDLDEYQKMFDEYNV